MDRGGPLGTHGHTDHIGGAHPYIEPKWPIMALHNPEHMNVQGKTPNQVISFISTMVHLREHMVVKNLKGGAHPDIELKWPIMAL